MKRFAMYEDMTVDDAVNIVNVANDCLAHDADNDLRNRAFAAKRSVILSGDAVSIPIRLAAWTSSDDY